MAPTVRPFDHLTILDLSDEVGGYCSKLFANQGAEVIMVEPIGGFRLRRIGPFIGNRPHIDYGIEFNYLSTDKKSICCNLESKDGLEIFSKLIKKADVVIESFKPKYLESIGMSYDEIKKINPNIIWCSITPFGIGGPYEDYQADDLVSMSMGGMTYLAGYLDSSPLLTYGKQSYYMASLMASVSIMIALHNRKQLNEGQFIDLSIQDCVALGTETAPQFYDLQGWIRGRTGETREPAVGIYPCKDGYVAFWAGELGSRVGWLNLIQWLQEEKVPGAERFSEPKWNDREWKRTPEAKKEFEEVFLQFTMKYTKKELYLEGQKRKIACSAVYNSKDLYEDEHLNARNYFKKIQLKNGQEIVMPGAPYQMSESKWQVQHPAPALGEHTIEVLIQLGYEQQQIEQLFEMGVIG